MSRRTVSGITLTLLFIGMLAFTSSIQPVRVVKSDSDTLAEKISLSKNTITDWGASIRLSMRGILLGETTITELDKVITNYRSNDDWVNVLETKTFAELLNYSSDTIDNTVKWALNYAPMFTDYALPKTHDNYFSLWRRHVLHGYRYSRELEYLTEKWNVTSAFEGLKACRVSFRRAFYKCNPDTLSCADFFGTRWMSTANLADCFMILYRETSDQTALDYALREWEDLNNYYWTGTHYRYARTWNTWEWSGIEVFFNYEKLQNLNGTLGNWTRVYSDLQNRYLASLWGSPQWRDKVVAHSSDGVQRRLHGTEDAWLMLLTYFGNFNSTNQSNMQNLLEGQTVTQAWRALLSPEAGLYDPTSHRFKIDSNKDYSDYATAEGCITLFLMGISTQNGSGLMIPKRCHGYSGEPFSIDVFGFFYDSRQIVIPVYGGTTLKFMFGSSHPTYTFSEDDIYRITFSPDWNSITSVEPIKARSWIFTMVPDDYPTIQEAINNANDGGTIFVLSGTYYENVIVNKTVLLIGEDKCTTIIDGNKTGSVIYVSADNVKITDFTIKNGDRYGIELYNSRGVATEDNNIVNNFYGVYLWASPKNNTIIRNNIVNCFVGILFTMNSENNTISRNNITANDHGILFGDSSFYNEIIGNDIKLNNQSGIYIAGYSANNIVIRNSLNSNFFGVKLDSSSLDNVIYHNNFINNVHQVDTDSVNIWDGGYPSGGNYWSNYAGVDSNGDGIGDIPYIIDTDNQDRYPLMNPWGTGTPVTNFTWTPSIPKVGESVTFNASSSTPNGGEIVSYKWNFGDDKYGSGKTVAHTYASSGVYTVTLSVTDSEGLWDIEQEQIQVVQPHSPKAEFTAMPDSASTGESIKFDASASLSGWNGTHEMPITECRWVFGDGNKTTTCVPMVYHSFSSSGIYYVILTVYAPGATPETDSITHKVSVTSASVGGYSFPIKRNTTTKSLAAHIALVAILPVSFTIIRCKRHKRKKRS